MADNCNHQDKLHRGDFPTIGDWIEACEAAYQQECAANRERIEQRSRLGVSLLTGGVARFAVEAFTRAPRYLPSLSDTQPPAGLN